MPEITIHARFAGYAIPAVSGVDVEDLIVADDGVCSGDLSSLSYNAKGIATDPTAECQVAFRADPATRFSIRLSLMVGKVDPVYLFHPDAICRSSD